jgi:hypothetical protein
VREKTGGYHRLPLRVAEHEPRVNCGGVSRLPTN